MADRYYEHLSRVLSRKGGPLLVASLFGYKRSSIVDMVPKMTPLPESLWARVWRWIRS